MTDVWLLRLEGHCVLDAPSCTDSSDEIGAGATSARSLDDARDLVKVTEHRDRRRPAPGALTPKAKDLAVGELDLEAILRSAG